MTGRHVPGCDQVRCDPWCPTGLPGTGPAGGVTATVAPLTRPSCADAQHPPGAHQCPGCERPVFTCPRCRRTSHHPKDAEHHYCGACHDFTSAPELSWAIEHSGDMVGRNDTQLPVFAGGRVVMPGDLLVYRYAPTWSSG